MSTSVPRWLHEGLLASIVISVLLSGRAEAKIVVCLSLSAQRVVVGDPLTATVSLSNIGEKTVRVREGVYHVGTHLMVTRKGGETLPYQGPVPQQHPGWLELAGGQKLIYEFDVTSLFRPWVPGVYVVRAYNGEGPNDPNAILSEPVEFEVTEGEVLYSNRITMPYEVRTLKQRGATMEETIGKTVITHELKLIQGETGLRAVYYTVIRDYPENEFWQLLGDVQPRTLPVFMVGRGGAAHILWQTSDTEYAYWASGYGIQTITPETPQFGYVRYPPELYTDAASGEIRLRPP